MTRPLTKAPGSARTETAAKRRRRRKLPGIAIVLSYLVLAVVVMAAIFPSLLAPHEPAAQNIARALRPPAWLPGGTPGNLLGTDALGRDILSRVVHGTRVSMLISLAAVLLQGTLGLVLGLVAGYFRGWLDAIIMRLADIQLAIPLLALVIAVVAVVGSSLPILVAVLGITGWVVYARVVRSEVLSVRELEFVQAARALGASDLRVVVRHVLGNVFTNFLVIATLQIALMILTESALSFLGLGVQPPTVSWGAMIAQGKDFIATHWWISLFPGAAIFSVVLAINLIGDHLRDRLDPTLQV